MDIDKFEKFVFDKTASYSDIITYDNNLICQASANDNNQMLFLTIPYDEGWICTINGNGQPIENVFDGFIGIPLLNLLIILKDLSLVPSQAYLHLQ